LIFISRKLLIVIVVLLVIALIIPVAIKIHTSILRFRYPVKYIDIIEKYADKYDIDPFLVLAVMKAESNFDPDAVSVKGAKGLMQIHPDTGEWIAKTFGLNGYKESDLFNPETNIKFSCWYLNKLNKEFNDPVLVLAAYNAGSGNVEKWLSEREHSSNQKKLDNIPFKETRDYIDRITRNYKMYKKIYKDQKKEGNKSNGTY